MAAHHQRIGEVSESDKVCQPVLRRKRRVLHHIGDVCPSQQLQITPHNQSVERPFNRRVEVDEQFAVDHAFFVAFHIQQLHIVGRQFQVRHHPGRIMNVDRPVDNERVRSRSIDIILVETDQVILYLDLLFVETER